MKKILFIMIMAYSGIFNAQMVSLELMSQCRFNPTVCPENYNYVKDVNNLLNKYVGTWKGSLEGKNYEFNFIKKENFQSEYTDVKWDMLIGRVKIIDQNSTVEFDNFSKSDNDANWGIYFQPDLKAYLVTFSGEKSGCIDYGNLYLRIKPETPDQMSIYFLPSMDIVKKDCTNFQTTLPQKTISLLKQ
ncbi:DUF6705 family protein [Chryseobacterium sp.]|uniref:DUF6705 family protein n=1 Tax=Chryseobacterium sp. TaxID=1871047 RepID=UPI00263857AD|nr:DUF6705 family protein [Chryseobacterium sp.]